MSRWSSLIRRAVAVAAVAGAGTGAVSAQEPAEPVPLPPVEPLVAVQNAPPPVDTAAAAVPVADAPAAPACGGCGGCDACKAFDFKKVPPVRVFPRMGNFPVPPVGKGTYSLLSHLQGKETDGPPKFGYPAFALMPPGFFDADFRYLDDPKTPPQDALDRLKRIHLHENWLLSIGGQVWNRYHNEYNSRLTNTDNIYNLYRARAYADLWYKDQFRVFAEASYTDTYWNDLPPLGIDRSRMDIQNLFADVKVGEVKKAPVYVRVGRQEILLGSQRLVSTLDWANTRRRFDGVRAFRAGEKWDFDAFWLRPVTPNAQNLDSSDNNQNFAGAWATYKPKKGTFVDFYYLMLDNTNRVTSQGVRLAPSTVHTIGGRYAGDRENELLWDVEGGVQLGTLDRQNIVAGFFTAGLGYHDKCRTWNPTVWAYYDYASGDNNPNGGTAHTFNQLFPFGHYYLGWADLVGRQNIHDVNFHLYLYPAKWMTVNLQLHNFWLAARRDSLYGIASGTAGVRRDPTGRAGNHVGTEVDAIVNFHLSKRSDLLISYAYLFGGEFLENTRAANRGPDASVATVLYSFRF